MAAPTNSSADVGVSLSLARTCKAFDGGVQAVADVSLEVPAGQFLALLGPSGCGKSTLLRMVAGLEPIDSGRILINDQPVMPRHRQAGMAFVFQDAHLLPWRNVLGNVELPLELMGQDKARRRELAARAIADVGLAEAAGRYPMQLSGGMRMRVSLARALVTKPKLLLLDEPFAALDELTRHKLDEQLLQLWQQSRMTVLFVTHSISEAAFLSERAMVLSARPARVVADIPVELGKQRGPELRTDPRFVDVMREIQQALRGDEA